MKLFSPWVKGFMAQFLCATVVITGLYAICEQPEEDCDASVMPGELNVIML